MPLSTPCCSVRLSAVIITRNEEKNIARCLRSVVPVADEVMVVDSFSTDNTRMICQSYGVNYIEHSFEGYGPQKTYAVQQAAHHCILSLDADEALSGTLMNEILSVKKHWTKDCYAFNRLTSFCGQWVRHGAWYPDRVIRLFDRRKAGWSGNLHEKILPADRRSAGFLKGCLLHYSYDSVSHYLQKTELYTTMAAAELYRENVGPGIYHFYIKPLYRFLHAFLIKGGFMDGYIGYYIARLDAERLFIKYVKLKMMYHDEGKIATAHHARKKKLPMLMKKMNADLHG